MATNNGINQATGATSTVLQGQGVGTAATFTATPAVTSISFGGTAISTFVQGTWTPGISINNSATGITYSNQGGSYTRINDMVFITGIIVCSAIGVATGGVHITGLPVNWNNGSINNFNAFSISFFSGLTLSAGYTQISGVPDAATTVAIYKCGSAVAAAGLSQTPDVLAATFTIEFSGIYKA